MFGNFTWNAILKYRKDTITESVVYKKSISWMQFQRFIPNDRSRYFQVARWILCVPATRTNGKTCIHAIYSYTKYAYTYADDWQPLCVSHDLIYSITPLECIEPWMVGHQLVQPLHSLSRPSGICSYQNARRIQHCLTFQLLPYPISQHDKHVSYKVLGNGPLSHTATDMCTCCRLLPPEDRV